MADTDELTKGETNTHGGFGVAPEDNTGTNDVNEYTLDEEMEDKLPAELEAAEKEKEEQAKAAEDEGPQFDDEILRMAEEAGLSREQAQEFGSVDDLERALTFWASRQEAPQEQQQAPPQQPPPPAQMPPMPPSDRDFKLEAPDMKELGEAYEPGLVGVIEQSHKFMEHTNKRTSEIEAAMAFIVNELKLHGQHFARTQQESEMAEADAYFASLGDEYEKEVGKGPIRGLKGAPQRMRAAIMREARRLEVGYRAQGEQPPPMSELYDRALHYAMRGKTSSIARQEIQTALNKRKGQAMNKPPRKRKVSDRSMEAGLQFADDFFRERGVEPGPPDMDEF